MITLPPNRPALMGIINVTPDSFSDGGEHLHAATAIDAGLRMLDEGADILDVGGESTRPGADEVPLEEELRRTIPVVRELAGRGASVSIDTTKAQVALEALQAGAKMVNDISAFSEPAMAEICREFGCTVCIMHMQGTPRTMQLNPTYADVVGEVRSFLSMAAFHLERDRGISADKIWIDPGVGFGKTVEHNLSLLAHLDVFVEMGYPVLVGVSRKSFIGKLLGNAPANDRLEGTLAAQVVAQMKGARCIRAHDVKQARRAIDMAAAIAATG